MERRNKMIDFNNKSIIKLKSMKIEEGDKIVREILIKNEITTAAFTSMRDKLVFTDKRIISINVQGISEKKIDYTSIPYSKIQTYSVEIAGFLDLDAELDVTISGLGTIRFELTDTSNINKNMPKNIWKSFRIVKNLQFF